MHDFKVGDICRYPCGSKNKSDCTVEIVRIVDDPRVNDPRGYAVAKFLSVRVDDSGNGYFSYLRRTGKTMNVSFKYLMKEKEA